MGVANDVCVSAEDHRATGPQRMMRASQGVEGWQRGLWRGGGVGFAEGKEEEYTPYE